MGSFEEKTSRTLQREYDVAVIGGGLSGFAAARACGKAGLNTLLVERRSVLGWESTWGFALDFIESKSEAVRWLAAVMKAKGGSRTAAWMRPSWRWSCKLRGLAALLFATGCAGYG